MLAFRLRQNHLPLENTTPIHYEDPMHPISGIYGLCDTTFCPQESHESLAQKLLAGGVRIVQLRMKGETNLAKVRNVAEGILRLKQEFDFTFILNDFVELGLELGVDGLHVGQDDLPLEQVREMAGPDYLIGYSSHSLEEAAAAEKQGAGYVALGAIYPTPTKGPGHPVVGVETLRQVVRRLRVPVVAIGGIVPENFQEVLSTGVPSVAMISALAGAPDITGAARWFVDQFKIYSKEPA